MSNDAGAERPSDGEPGASERQPPPDAATGEHRGPNLRDRAVDRLSNDRPDAERGWAYANDVTPLGMQTNLRERGWEYLEAIHNDAFDPDGDTRRNRDEGYRAAAVQAEHQGLPDLADAAIDRISVDGIRDGIGTAALMDTASQAALMENPDRVVELIGRIPDEHDRNTAWDRIAEISGVDDA